MSLALLKMNADVSYDAIKFWLKFHGLPHSASNKTFPVFIERQIELGKISDAHLAEAIRDIEENGGKRVYLRQLRSLDNIKTKEAFEKHLSQFDIQLSAHATTSIRKPTKSKRNYVYWGEKEIRVKFSETHIHWKGKGPDAEAITRTKFIIFAVEHETGFVKLILDHPGDKHDHLSELGNPTEAAYIGYYLEQLTTLIGESEEINIAHQINYLLDVAEPREIQAVNTEATDDDGYEVRVKGRSDVHQSGSYETIQHQPKSSLKGQWLKTHKNDKIGNKDSLIRDITLRIRPGDGMLSFTTMCLGKEVDYVISRIRALQKAEQRDCPASQ